MSPLHNWNMNTARRQMLQRATHRKRRRLERDHLHRVVEDDADHLTLPQRNAETGNVWSYD